MSRCKNCGFIMGDEDKFCNACGYPQDLSKEDRQPNSTDFDGKEKGYKKSKTKKRLIILSSIVLAFVMVGVSAMFFLGRNKFYKTTNSDTKVYAEGGVVFLKIEDQTITEDNFKQTINALRHKIEEAGIKKYEISRYNVNEIKIDFKDKSEKGAMLSALNIPKIRFTDQNNEIFITNKDIYSAEAYKNTNGIATIGIILTDEGAEKMRETTKRYKGEVMFIFIDNELVVSFEIPGAIAGKFKVWGTMSIEQAKKYAEVMKDNNMPLKLKILQSN